MRNIRVFLLFSLAVCPAVAQRNAGLPDVDVRNLQQLSGARAPQSQLRARALIATRSAALAAFAEDSRSAQPGLRVTGGRHGLPKLLTRDGGALTGPSSGDPDAVSRDFLRRNTRAYQLSGGEVDALRTTLRDVSPAGTYLSFTQTIDGLDVFEGNIRFTLNSRGELLQVAAGELIPGVSVVTRPTLTPEQARDRARGPLKSGEFLREPELIIFPLDAATARLAYRVYFEADAAHSYEVVVDALDGTILYRHNNTTFVAARIWKESPITGSRELVDLPAEWLPVNGTLTTGNNVDAYIDADGNERPDTQGVEGLANGHASATGGAFDFPFGDGTSGEDPRGFKAASVSNVFYLLNVAHDYYYKLGFTEAAGNFQTDNFGRGGRGGDAVLGMAQHGASTNNASFTPTPDGTPGRARFGLFTRGTSARTDDRDSSYDGQIVMHEYGHGVTNRLIGGGTSTSCLTGIQAGAMGEGWSDYFAASFYNNPVMGAYSTANAARGIRRQSYEGYSFGYEDVGNTGYEVHDDGEIWTAVLWDLRTALGQVVTDNLVVAGLKSTPCKPSMTDARDGILTADKALNNGANRAAIWTVFARHGMGSSATGIEGAAVTGTVYDAAFDLPEDLQPARSLAITSKPLQVLAGLGDNYDYTITATNPAAGSLLYSLGAGPAGMAVNPGTGAMSWRGTFTPQRVKVSVTDGKGGRIVHGYMAPMNTRLSLGTPLTVEGAEDSTGAAYVDVPAGVPVLQFATRSGTGDPDVFVTSPSGDVYFSAHDGLDETVSIASPGAGRWKIQVSGFDAYSGVSLTAAAITPTLLSANSVTTGIGGVLTSERFYRLVVPPQTALLRISTSGDNGDVDLYVNSGSPAACQEDASSDEPCVFRFKSASDGANEFINIQNPSPGEWFLALTGYDPYSGLTLRTAVTLREPDLTVISRHTGSFRQGQKGALYSLLVSNAGATETTGAITVTSALPAGVTATVMEGAGWTCVAATLTCTRADSLGADRSFPEIVLTVDVGLSVPVSVVPTATVSGGGDASPANNTARDVTLIGNGGAAPVILTGGVVPVYSSSTSVQAGSWISIYGLNFAGAPVEWQGDFPTDLGGVTVTVNGKPAFIWFVNPTQINVQTPDDSTLGPVDVVVTTGNGTATGKVTLAAASPSFSLLGDGKHLAGVIPTGATYDLVGPAGAFAFRTRPAKPGEVVVLYGVGFGATVSPVPAGQVFSGGLALQVPPVIKIGGVPAQVSFAGMTGAGLYQFNLVVPAGLGSGDKAVQATLAGGVATLAGPVLAIE